MVSLHNYYLFIIFELDYSTHLKLVVNYVVLMLLKDLHIRNLLKS
jgi:hypothetical protein